VVRRGGTVNGLLVALCALGGLSTAALVLEPRIIFGEPDAEGPPTGPVTAAHEAHQDLINKLAALIEQSIGVLAIHPRGAGRYEEIVLWVDDDTPNGQGWPDEREIAIVSHSPVMRTITIYRIVGPGEPGKRNPGMGSLAFCEALRADRRCGTLVVASGVADMRVETVARATGETTAQGARADPHRLRLTLTWTPDSADGPDEASVLVNAIVFSSTAE
jgi:hypothetical protein